MLRTIFKALVLIFAAMAVTSCCTVCGQELPLLFQDDFSKGASAWKASDANAWQVIEVEGNAVYENKGGSAYSPPFRSPFNLSILQDVVVGDFVLTARVMSRQSARPHRDMCLIFGYQDEANFYYVHLGQETDPHSNQIFLVNEAPRRAISDQASAGTPWQDETWHTVKIERDTASGRIAIYFDDMEHPCHVAHDKTFRWGRIGIGTFDDLGWWDDIELRGVAVEHPVESRQAPEKLAYEKWTPDFLVPDPVAISFDSQGVAYVTQTLRRQANDLDIRPNSDWIPDDLSFTSTEDKAAFYVKQFTPENSAANAHRVKDWNGDGIHDIRDLTHLSERIHRITDKNGDGFADHSEIFVEQMDSLLTGVAGGVLVHDGYVYASPVPELVRFKERPEAKEVEKEVLVSGFGVHLAYAGHDMHGLVLGPDGRIYWTIGDKGIRVKTPDGLDFRFPHQGGTMRCEPDGSNFEVFAHGQRNIQEIDFDQYGNWFGVDNDADYPGERERFVHIEHYMDTGWRSQWQYLRGRFNPWVDEKMHELYHEDQPYWFVPTLGLYENGPAGFKFQPGTALSPAYENYFFLTSAPNGQQWAFQAKRSGDSFAMVNDHQIGKGVPIVGLSFAPDGALYGVDWGGGYPLNQNGAVWRLDVPEGAADPRRTRTSELISEEFAQVATNTLVEHLRYPDRRIRLKAQFELAKRDDAATLARIAADKEENQLARIHAIWGVGQLLRRDLSDDSVLTALFLDLDPEIRAQAVKTVTDRYGRHLALDRIGPVAQPVTHLTDALQPLLNDRSQRVRVQVLLGLARVADPASNEALVKTLSHGELHHQLTYLRHAGAMALASTHTGAELAALHDSKSEFLRVCAVVALRRQGAPEVTAYLNDPQPRIAAEAARAIHDEWSITEALPALAATLGKVTNNEPLTLRAISANHRLGDAAAAARVVHYVLDEKASEQEQAYAVEALQHWTTPDRIDLVDGFHRGLPERESHLAASALKPYLAAFLAVPRAETRTAAMELARNYQLTIPHETLLTLAQDPVSPGPIRAEALHTLGQSPNDAVFTLLEQLLSDDDTHVAIAALDQWVKHRPDEAAREIQRRVESKAPLEVRQHAIRQLTSIPAQAYLSELVTQLVAGEIAPELQLDVLETAQNPAFATVDSIGPRVAAMEAQWQAASATDSLAPYRVAIAGGNAERGKNTFFTHAAGQCLQCHKVDNKAGSNVGPNLKSIGQHRTPENLLASLVDPQRDIAKGYGNIMLSLKNGSSVGGQYLEEKNQKIVIVDAEKKKHSYSLDDIAQKSPVVSTMPPMGLILTKRELRDMVAYLSSLKSK